MKLATIERLLTAEKARLLAQIGRIEAEFAAPMDDDLTEQAVEREDDEALDGAERVAADRIGAIDAALSRLRAGTYGICVRCGEPIAPRRLAAMPEAAICMECASTAGETVPR